MATDTHETDPYAQYNFEVEVDGEAVAGFAEVAGITMELETVPYREGGVNDHVHQLPGQFAHANLVLQRGLTKNTTFWEWIQTVMSGTLTRKNIVVTVKDGFRGESQWGWEFAGAYPTKWSGPDLVSTDRGMAIESIELAYERFSTLSGMPG
ncbi:phage tail-like protein [Natrinema hispanicum]|uniref:Phage tail-like protein n=1 Tax=Natrinema hispanicum TaxID=392421 RepID=A0A482Y9G9_9EURY|nr:phage tail protein [Natrinema hispanicum]RZV11873.1 phage tail-like protein [Natrinema hispanicum]